MAYFHCGNLWYNNDMNPLKDNKLMQTILLLLAVCAIVGILSAIHRNSQESLTDYAAAHPDIAYAESDNSWRDSLHGTDVSANP